jgi:hypothetical protein
MNIIGSLRAVNDILAVGISFAAAANNIPSAEKAKAPTAIAARKRNGFAIRPPLNRAAPIAVMIESIMPKAELANDLPKIMVVVETGAI